MKKKHETVKPCPFCGNKPFITEVNERHLSSEHDLKKSWHTEKSYTISCQMNVCPVDGLEVNEYDLKLAIKRWNSRPDHPLDINEGDYEWIRD